MNGNIKKWFDGHAHEVTALAKDMFDHPETAYEETHACGAVADYMRGQGFAVRELDVQDKGGAPNCVVATHGSGKPVIGFLGELDALPALGQAPVPHQSPIPGPGHGCGHHLIGSSAAGAAAALKTAMEAEGLAGTVMYFGCPAEEVLAGKVYMAKLGLFNELDAAVTWHPMGMPPGVLEGTPQANTNMYFTFHGKTAHAAASPHEGRSALDACELMNVGVNYLREHVPTDVRMHYSYISAGDKPNIVPDYAKLHYFIRSRSAEMNEDVMERVIDCARGAATMTGTTMEYEINAVCHETLPISALNKAMHEVMMNIPPLEYDEADQAFAREVYQNFNGQPAEIELLPTEVAGLTGVCEVFPGSTDVGDVSQITPTVQVFGGGVVNTLPQHHWSTTAVCGSPIGYKAGVYAAKLLAQCAYDLMTDAPKLEEIRSQFSEARKGRRPYKPTAAG